MTILIYFLTIVFGIVCFVIMKKKRYKVMPLICLIMFICFIGCGIVSILSLTLPYGEILVYPLGAIIFGLVFILVGVNDLYSLLRCREKVDGVYSDTFHDSTGKVCTGMHAGQTKEYTTAVCIKMRSTFAIQVRKIDQTVCTDRSL